MRAREGRVYVDFLQNGLTDPRVAQALPPFDRPTLHSQVLPPNPLVYGPGSSGSFALPPFVIPFQPVFAGNPQYTVGVGHVTGQAAGLLAVATTPGSSTISGIPVNIGLTPLPELVPVTMSGPPVPGQGFGSLTLAIPNNLGAIGQQFFLQWFVVDPMAPGGIAASRGLQVTVF